MHVVLNAQVDANSLLPLATVQMTYKCMHVVLNAQVDSNSLLPLATVQMTYKCMHVVLNAQVDANSLLPLATVQMTNKCMHVVLNAQVDANSPSNLHELSVAMESFNDEAGLLSSLLKNRCIFSLTSMCARIAANKYFVHTGF